MNKKLVIYLFLNICLKNLQCASSNDQNVIIQQEKTSILIQFQDQANCNLFIQESVSLPGEIFFQSPFTIFPYYLIFDFNNSYTKQEIDTLFYFNISALCEYNIVPN